MGLDMYAYTVPAEAIGDQQVDIELFEKGKERFAGTDRSFAYWRKFNNLHQWMAGLYEAKGGRDANFNCNTVRLTLEDLDKLEREALNLEPAAGFFWGEQNPMAAEDVAEVMEFVTRARSAIGNGQAVVYDSWW